MKAHCRAPRCPRRKKATKGTLDYAKKAEWKKQGVVIVQKRKRGKLDSFFYDGEVAYVKRGNTVFSLLAGGDIGISIGEHSYRSGNDELQVAIRRHRLSDKKFDQLSKENKIEWLNNNWFEVTWCEFPDGEVESEMGDVTYTYDEGIQMLIDKANEYDKTQTGE
jgi:hypothetical protein